MALKISSRRLYFFVLTWAALFLLVLITLVGQHHTSLVERYNNYWSSSTVSISKTSLGDTLENLNTLNDHHNAVDSDSRLETLKDHENITHSRSLSRALGALQNYAHGVSRPREESPGNHAHDGSLPSPLNNTYHGINHSRSYDGGWDADDDADLLASMDSLHDDADGDSPSPFNNNASGVNRSRPYGIWDANAAAAADDDDDDDRLSFQSSSDGGGSIAHLKDKDLSVFDKIKDSTQHRRFMCTVGKPTNIVFIKVHKSGSTTIANLFARYALRHKLNIALPNKRPHTRRFNYFSLHDLDTQAIPIPPAERYHILFNHMIYNRTALKRLMPSRTFYCAVMREPLSRFTSSVNYYFNLLPENFRWYLLFGRKSIKKHPSSSKQKPLTIQPTPENLDLAQLLKSPGRKVLERFSEIFSSLASDTGLPVNLQKIPAAVTEHALRLDQELDLMMVMEHFHESLVLLKRRACLSMKDIVYMQLNSAKTSRVRKLSDSDKDAVRTWQAADHYLYDFFYHKFQTEVKNEGETFWEEVDVFKQILQKTQSFCEGLHSRVLRVAASPWNEEFTLTAEDCQLMQLKEGQFQTQLITRAWRRLADSGVYVKPELLKSTQRKT